MSFLLFSICRPNVAFVHSDKNANVKSMGEPVHMEINFENRLLV